LSNGRTGAQRQHEKNQQKKTNIHDYLDYGGAPLGTRG
jgi:hypothetical protein